MAVELFSSIIVKSIIDDFIMPLNREPIQLMDMWSVTLFQATIVLEVREC